MHRCNKRSDKNKKNVKMLKKHGKNVLKHLI